MDQIIFFLLTISYLFLLALMIFSRNRIKTDIVLILVIFALLYDNLVLAIGEYIGEGTLLKNINIARYWLHAFITPLLVIFAWNTLVKANIYFAKKKLVKTLAILFSFALMLFKIVTILNSTNFEPKWEYGILSYEMVKGLNIPSIMIIGVMISLLITSLIVWWKQKWPWYFVGVISMAIAPLINFFIETGTSHNITELILIIALIKTKAFQDKNLLSV
mgnify:CR=1 FL=1